MIIKPWTTNCFLFLTLFSFAGGDFSLVYSAVGFEYPNTERLCAQFSIIFSLNYSFIFEAYKLRSPSMNEIFQTIQRSPFTSRHRRKYIRWYILLNSARQSWDNQRGKWKKFLIFFSIFSRYIKLQIQISHMECVVCTMWKRHKGPQIKSLCFIYPFKSSAHELIQHTIEW